MKSRPGRRWWQPLSLRSYSDRVAAVQFVFWLVAYTVSAGGFFFWWAGDGVIDHGVCGAMCAWMGFFAGWVGCYSGSLQAQRALILGYIDPASVDCKRLATRRRRSLYFWIPAWLAGVLLSLACFSFFLALSQLGTGEGYSRPQFLFYTALVPAVATSVVARLSAWRAAEQFLAARAAGDEQRVPRGRYIWLHAVLPYLPVSLGATWVLAEGRFHQAILSGRPVPIDEAVHHLSLNMLVAGLLLPAVARLKVRTDVVSPRFPAAGPAKIRVRFSYLVPAVLSCALYLAPVAIADLPPVAASRVAWYKVGVNLIWEIVLLRWAVGWELYRCTEAVHPYFEKRRRIEAWRRKLDAWRGQVDGHRARE